MDPQRSRRITRTNEEGVQVGSAARWFDLAAFSLVLAAPVLLVVLGHAEGLVLVAASQFVVASYVLWRKRV